MAVRYRPRFPPFTSTPPRPTRPERLFRDGGGRGARQDSKHCSSGNGWPGPGPGSRLESCRAPPPFRRRRRRIGADPAGDRRKAGPDGARQNSKSGSRRHRCGGRITGESWSIRLHDSEISDSEAIRGRIEMSRLESCRVGRKIHRQRGLSAGVLSREFWSFVARLAILYWSLVAQTIN